MTMSMLKWIDTSSDDSNLPKSKKGLWSTLGRNDRETKRHLYCSVCMDYLGRGKTIEYTCSCGACNHENKTNPKMTYFLEVSLRQQLMELPSIPGIADDLNYRTERKKKNPQGIEDIYDSAEYVKLCEPGGVLENPYNFTYKFYTDGARISESSNASAWSIFVEINELPPHARKKHIMLAGVFVDCKHPIANTFALPFVKQANKLYEKGIRWKPDGKTEVTSKFIPVIFCADSGARWDFLSMTQFNGAFGCTFCYAPGVVLPGPSNQSKYPFDDNSALRTDEEIRLQGVGALATEGQKREFGLQGTSALAKLHGFNIASGVIVDSMHNVYLGVYKQHFHLLLTTAGAPYYIGSPQQITMIDARLQNVKMPSCISRKPRSLKHFKQFKASEWRNWGYYGLQCLEGVLPLKYLKHLALLFEAAYILNKNSVTADEIDYAEELLTEYRRLFQRYFGLAQMTYNIHLLKHLCSTVRNWGPFWVHSAFTFESMNKKIIDSVTSSNGPAWQIYTRFMLRKFVFNSVQDPTVSAETVEFISELLHIPRICGDAAADTGLRTRFKSLGVSVRRPPYDWEIQALGEAGYECTDLRAFEKAQIDGIEYRCVDFKPNTKFQNTVVFCDEVGFGEILGIVVFHSGNQSTQGIFLRCLMDKGYAFGTKFIKNVSMTERVIFLTTPYVTLPAFVVNTSKGLRAIHLPNVWESD